MDRVAYVSWKIRLKQKKELADPGIHGQPQIIRKSHANISHAKQK